MPRTTAPPPALPLTPGSRGSRLRTLLAALGAGLALSLSAVPAHAHDELRSSTPADGDSLAQPPTQVVLTFEEPPVELGTQVVVTGPNGAVSSGSPRVEGDTVVQPLQPDAPAGRYTVEWRVTSDDGHPVSGSFGFTAQAAAGGSSPSAAATAPATPAATPVGEPRREPLIPSWGWILVGVIIIVAAVRLNRRARADQQED